MMKELLDVTIAVSLCADTILMVVIDARLSCGNCGFNLVVIVL